jgi:hypothetical protein
MRQERDRKPEARNRSLLIAAVIVAFVVLFVVLHVTGVVGAGSH